MQTHKLPPLRKPLAFGGLAFLAMAVAAWFAVPPVGHKLIDGFTPQEATAIAVGSFAIPGLAMLVAWLFVRD